MVLPMGQSWERYVSCFSIPVSKQEKAPGLPPDPFDTLGSAQHCYDRVRTDPALKVFIVDSEEAYRDICVRVFVTGGA